MKNEYKVGITVFLALVSLFTALSYIQDFSILGNPGREYTVTFKFLNNLMVGGHVKLYGGIKVGVITSMTHKDGNAHVNFLVTDKTVNSVILGRNTKLKLSIKGAGMLGEKYLLIEMGHPKGKKFNIEKDGDKIVKIHPFEGAEGADLEAMFEKVDSVIESVKPLLASVQGHLDDGKVASILSNLSDATGNLNKLLNNTNDMIVNIKDNHIDKTFNNVDKALEGVNVTIRSTNKEIGAISRGLRKVLSNTDRNLDNLFYNKKSGVHQITGEAVSVLKNMNKLVDNLKVMMSNLDNPKTPVGALLKDEDLTEDIKETINNLNDLTDSLKKHPLIQSDDKAKKGPF